MKIYRGASQEQVRAKAALIAAACEETKEVNYNQTRWAKIKSMHTNPANFRALVSACGLMVISQLSGFNTLMYYSSTLFALVCTVWGMAAGLLAVAIAFHFIPVNTHTLQLESTTVSTPAIVVLVFIIWFVLFYGVSVGNCAWMSTD